MKINSDECLKDNVFTKSVFLKSNPDDFGPIQTDKKRIVIVDVLRGFALFGVLLVHLVFAFSGWSFLSTAKAASLPLSFLDEFLGETVRFFFSHKFRGIFSFLFGLSFSIQMVRSIEKGLPYKKIFYKRMLILLLFGCIHAYFFWHGDVLRWYVIAGIILLWVHKWKPKNILITGIILSTVIPIVNSSLMRYTGGFDHQFLTSNNFLNFLGGSSIPDLLYANFLWDMGNNLNPFYRINFVLVILGQFMIGYWVGINNVFKNYRSLIPEFKTFFWIGSILGVGGTGIVFLFKKISSLDFIHFPAYIKYAMEVPESVGIMALSLAYVCGITLLHERPFWKNKLGLFIPVGRMALTNYIMQSIICIGIFYGIGLGLLGQLSLLVIIPLCFIIYSFQIVFSAWWLKNYHSGPLEWIWRSLMMGKLQPFFKNKSNFDSQSHLNKNVI